MKKVPLSMLLEVAYQCYQETDEWVESRDELDSFDAESARMAIMDLMTRLEGAVSNLVRCSDDGGLYEEERYE